MKKTISVLLILITLFNFIFCNRVYAAGGVLFEGESSINEDTIPPKSQESLANEGSVTDGANENGEGGTETSIGWNVIGTATGFIPGIITAVINVFPMLMQLTMIIVCDTANITINPTNLVGGTMTNPANPIANVAGSTSISITMVTIENIVFNEIPLFNINYFNFDDTYTIGTGNNEKVINNSDVAETLKESVAKFFIILRLIAIALSLLTLIYIGIRMALSTLSNDKAKYKKMLMAWFESIIILFLMQYIISILINVSEVFSNMLYDIKCTIDTNGEMSFETEIMNTIYSFMFVTSGWTYVVYSIMFWFLVFIQTKFFLSYLKRLIIVGFLILISPIVTVIYSIDKVGDGKAQAFWHWFNELTVNVFIQPIHAIIYLVFMYTAGEIAKQSMLVALIFLLALTKVEKIILQLFNIRNVVSFRPVDEERKKG